MAKTEGHSRGPYYARKDQYIMDTDGFAVASVFNQVDLKFALRCFNSHDKLLLMCRDTVELIQYGLDHNEGIPHQIIVARLKEAIKEAEG